MKGRPRLEKTRERAAETSYPDLKKALRQKHFWEKLIELGVAHRTGFVDAALVDRIAPELVELLAIKNRTARINALDLLIELGPTSTASALLNLLSDSDPELSERAAKGLRQLQRCDEHLLATLLTTLSNRSGEVAVFACEALYRLQNVEEIAVPDLLAALSSTSNLRVGETMAWLLARNGEKNVPDLVAALSSSSPSVRLGAVKALYLLHVAKQAPAALMDALLHEEHLPIRAWTTVAVTDSTGAPSDASLQSLAELLQIEPSAYHSPELLRESIRLLARAGERASGHVSQVLARRRQLGGTAWQLPIEAFGYAAIPQIRAAVTAGHVARHESFVWFGKLGFVEALTELDDLVKSGEGAGPAASCYGLFGPEGLKRAESVLDDPSRVSVHAQAVEGLTSAGEAALPIVAKALASGAQQTKLAAAHTMADVGVDTAVPYLVRALQDSVDRVRIASACALMKIRHSDQALQLLKAEWEQAPAVVASELERSGAGILELLPQVLAALTEPDLCSYVIGAARVMGEHSTGEARVHIVDTLARMSGLWTSLRSKAVTAAALLQRPSVAVPFPTLRYGVS
jgi:HEAT repeat protein